MRELPVSLVEQAVAGDARALDALWRESRGWLAVIILAYLPREVELEDALQDVALAIVRSIPTLREPALARPWLRRTAINVVQARGRRVGAGRRRRAWLVPGRRVHDELPASDLSDLNDAIESAVQLARALPEKYREPLLLSAVHGLTAEQIAAVLERSVKTVETQIRRARQRVREAMASKGDQGPALKLVSGGASHERS